MNENQFKISINSLQVFLNIKLMSFSYFKYFFTKVHLTLWQILVEQILSGIPYRQVILPSLILIYAKIFRRFLEKCFRNQHLIYRASITCPETETATISQTKMVCIIFTSFQNFLSEFHQIIQKRVDVNFDFVHMDQVIIELGVIDKSSCVSYKNNKGVIGKIN